MGSSVYAPPAVTSAGISINQYPAILQLYLNAYLSIFGPNAYLGADGKDYQLMSVIALCAADANAALQLCYNNMQAQNVTGPSMDALFKINGIKRKIATYSTCPVTLTGAAGAVVTNGLVSDINGNVWVLPTPVTIGAGGNVTVTAVCQTLGAITANIGTITTILTPTSGWISATNGSAASPGQPVETDSQFRARQAVSTQLPSSTLLAGTIAAIASLPGVTRYTWDENVTNSSDGDGAISHSIWMVVEGGVPAAIEQAIYANKGPGCGLNGTTSGTVTDPNTGQQVTIYYSQPTYQQIYVSMTVHLLPGSNGSATLAAIQNAVIAYLNGLQIGETVVYSALYAAAMSACPNLSMPIYSIRSLYSGTSASPSGTSDITLAFNVAAQATNGTVPAPTSV